MKAEMNDSTDEYSTPKINGEGDCLKNISVRRRIAIPSSRKFNARAQRDETLKIKIGDALSELQGKSKGTHSCLKKARTVAEITPTKSKAKKTKRPPIAGDEHTTATLHATPRPLDPTPASSSSRRCLRERAVCTVYQRLLLCVWRRCRARLASLTDSCGRQRDQINQLQIQVDVLKNLRNSECQKRTDALAESQQLRKTLDTVEFEKDTLIEKLKETDEELDKTRAHLKSSRFDLRKCMDQIACMREELKRKNEAKIEYLSKIAKQEQEILTQKSLISQLEGALKTTGKNLQNSESNYRIKQEEFTEILQQLHTEVDLNNSLREQVSYLQENKSELENQTRDLENMLDEYIYSCEQLKEENMTIKNNLDEISCELVEEKRKTWLKNTKEMAMLSLTALQKVAYIMLPAYLDNPC